MIYQFYYNSHKSELSLCVDIDSFWQLFQYKKADQFDVLKANVIDKLIALANDRETAEALYYPNAFSIVSDLSARENIEERTVKKTDFIQNLINQKTVLVTRWSLAALDRKKILKSKRQSLGSYFALNTPVYFDINEVYRYIKNKNNEVINKNETTPHLPKRFDGSSIENADATYLCEDVVFAPTSTAKETKASNGPYNGEFERFITRLETKLLDKRLKFITSPQKQDGTPFKTIDFDVILQQFLGYVNRSNITIIDLSAIPFEVLSIVISLLSRVIFDFAFHYSKLRHEVDAVNDIPFMLVCEEAHNYIPRNGGAEYNAAKHSIERIAKEGRKYGLNLMVVSQRPSEVSETIFSQCNNFVVLKLTNINDQNCIKNLLPDNNSSLVDILPTLSTGECLVVGDAVPLPAIVKMEMPSPTPSSGNVNVFDEWQKDWINIAFEEVIKRWRKE